MKILTVRKPLGNFGWRLKCKHRTSMDDFIIEQKNVNPEMRKYQKTIYLTRKEAEQIALFVLGDITNEMEVVEKGRKVSC